MNSIIAEIFQWSQEKLDFWEQLLLDKLIAKQELEPDDYKECLDFLLQDAQLAENQNPHPTLGFLENIPEDDTSLTSKKMHIRGISDIQNVNALVSNQHLTFNNQLTVVYGKNGSGKSGYARVIGCAGFTRGNEEILRDVLANPDDTALPYAKIELVDDDGEISELEFTGNSIPVMSRFYMFDSAAIDAHLKNQNEMSFSPAGLMHLKFLAGETDAVRELLTKEINDRKEKKAPLISWNGETYISQLLDSVNAQTNLDDLRDLAHLTDENRERLTNLGIEIAKLETQDTQSLIEERNQELEDINALLENHISKINQSLEVKSIEIINEVISTYHQISETINQYNLDDLKHPQLHQTGTSEWRKFADTAFQLAQIEHQNYPQIGDVCLLCHQSIDTPSQEHIQRLWSFLRQGAQVELANEQEQINQYIESFEQLNLDFFDEESVFYRYLSENHPQTLAEVQNFLQNAQEYRGTVLEALNQRSRVSEQVLLDISETLLVIIQNIEEQIIQLGDVENIEKHISELKNEKLILEHRNLVFQYLSQIEEYVENCQWIDKAEKIGGSTKKITKKHNELFGIHVTDKFLEMFSNTLKELKRPLQVAIETKGKKGHTFKQLVLKSSSSNTKSGAKPDQVLSEGEKRVVAFADFMAEVTLDPECAGIILDDPVTSLDIEWRRLIADMIVNEVQNRQVVVFTHDSPFLYLIRHSAEERSVACDIHWITRGVSDGKPGYIHLDNAPVLEKDYKKSTRADEKYKLAKDEQNPEKHHELLKDGMTALRTSYEALVVFDLLNEVVQRYDDRISIGRLSGIVADETIIKEIETTFSRLSRYIEGHLHVDYSPHESLTLNILRTEIDSFNVLRKNVRAKKK